jgi:hypothetical protein
MLDGASQGCAQTRSAARNTMPEKLQRAMGTSV